LKSANRFTHTRSFISSRWRSVPIGLKLMHLVASAAHLEERGV
jgi:hypothetical protein